MDKKYPLSSLAMNIRILSRLQRDGIYWVEELLPMGEKKFVARYGERYLAEVREILKDHGFKLHRTKW